LATIGEHHGFCGFAAGMRQSDMAGETPRARSARCTGCRFFGTDRGVMIFEKLNDKQYIVYFWISE
jgi:hypothetical protein